MASSDVLLWTFGFVLPLIAMAGYMVYGWRIVKPLNNEAKLSYGDSCYYIGFLFTVASIILSLWVLGQQSNITAEALSIRFAIAMVTTLLGMAARVTLVTFGNSEKKKETTDKIEPIEVNEGGGFRVLIEANLENLSLLNKSLVNNIEATERLRENAIALNARLISDLEVVSGSVKDFAAAAMTDTQKILTDVRDEFKKTINQSSVQMAKQLQDQMESVRKATEHIVEDAASSVKALSEESIKSINGETSAAAELLNQQTMIQIESIKKQAESINKLLADLSDQTKNGFAPVDGWENSIQHMTEELKSFVSEFGKTTRKIASSLEGRSSKLNDVLDEELKKVVNILTDLEEAASSNAEALNKYSTATYESTKRFEESLRQLERAFNDCNVNVQDKGSVIKRIFRLGR